MSPHDLHLLVAALLPDLPLAILVAKGEQGAGKLTACRVIGSLIDSRTSALRGVPREGTAAARNWLVCFDNLSRLPEDLAGAACRLATGGGFGGRQLYRDHSEAVFDATRPLVFNAIPDLGTARLDFLDRALVVEASPLCEPAGRAGPRGLYGTCRRTSRGSASDQNNPLPRRGNPADFCTAVIA